MSFEVGHSDNFWFYDPSLKTAQGCVIDMVQLFAVLFSLLISSMHCSGLSKLVRKLVNTSLF